MADSYIMLYGVLVIIAFPMFLQVQGLTLVYRPPNVTYVELGKTLTLNVTYETKDTVIVAWIKDGSNLYSTNFGSNDPRASLNGQGTLVLGNTTLSDNGTFQHFAQTSASSKSIFMTVIIQVKPTAVINCSDSTTVKEGENVECLCNSIRGNPPPIASWYKDGTLVGEPGYLKQNLSLKNISKENAGNYSCIVKSYDLNDTKQVEIQVLYKPTNISFKSEQGNIVSNGTSVTITCKAEAFPEPNYIIFHNDKRLLVRVHGTKTINPVNLCDNGHYKCVAKNSLGNVSASLNLIVKEQSNCSKGCINTEWYMFFITLVCGIFLGVLFVYAEQWLRRRLARNRKDNPRHNSEPNVTETCREEAENNETYQELNLETMNAEDNYQSLRMTTRRARNTEEKAADTESNYQELNKNRELENNYQSLNKV